MVYTSGQRRFYCKIATDKEKMGFQKNGYPEAMFSPNRPLGVNTIGRLFKEAAKRMGHETTGHAFRRLFITTIANAPGVSTEESLASSRHRSVSAQRQYMVRGKDSETAKLITLGFSANSETIPKEL